MLSTRAVGLGPSLRQAAFIPARTHALAISRPAIQMALTRRALQTESHPPSAATEILNKQRLHRPSSPHFTIYQPQLTWVGSIFNRAAGGALSALLYGFSLAYLFVPGTFDSAHIIEFVASLPDGVKYTGKALLAAPFAFHSFNGVRHLLWDSGKFLTLKGVYNSGYAVLAATAVGTAYMVFGM